MIPARSNWAWELRRDVWLWIIPLQTRHLVVLRFAFMFESS